VGERIRTEPLQIDELVQQTRAPEAGALAIFAGTVRCENDAKEVVGLEYTAYEPLAERELERLERDTEQRFGVTVCRLQHRIGPLQIGDTSVLVVVRAPHRAEAFAAARHAIDTLKQTVPVWKHERYADGTAIYIKGCALHAESSDPSVIDS